jgi:hypothetical protein
MIPLFIDLGKKAVGNVHRIRGRGDATSAWDGEFGQSAKTPIEDGGSNRAPNDLSQQWWRGVSHLFSPRTFSTLEGPVCGKGLKTGEFLDREWSIVPVEWSGRWPGLRRNGPRRLIGGELQ